MVKRKNTDVDTIAYKFRIYPDREQKIMLAKTFGCTRYLWNRMLAVLSYPLTVLNCQKSTHL